MNDLHQRLETVLSAITTPPARDWARDQILAAIEPELAHIKALESRKSSDDLAYEYVAEMCNQQIEDIRALEAEIALLRAAPLEPGGES